MSEARARLNALSSLYPKLFSSNTLPWGFEVGDGWSDLIVALCARIDSILKEDPNAQLQLRQVKEKFGTLRFYYALDGASDATSEAIREAVTLAESASAHICEQCGRPGEPGSRSGWHFTRCSVCQASGL